MITQLQVQPQKRLSDQHLPPVISLIKLTSREAEVLQHICDGRSMNEVAEILYLSTSTIISHKRKLFEKFGINNLVRLGVLAERYGFLD